MQVNRDFSELFAALNAEGARFLLIGGYALAYHSLPRFTKDLDVLVDPAGQNPERVHRALAAFGAPLAGLSVADLGSREIVFQIGIVPNRIDILTDISGVTWEEAWQDSIEASYGGEPIRVIGRKALIKNKLASGRPQDLLDAQRLSERT